MKDKIACEELIAIGVAHAISRSEKLADFNGLSILMEYREWICDDPGKYQVLTVPCLNQRRELKAFYRNPVRRYDWINTSAI